MRNGCTSRAGLAEREAKYERTAEALPHLQAIADAVRDVLYVVDTSGRLCWRNARLEQVTGLTVRELAGKPAVEFFPPEERTLVEESIQKVFREGSAEAELDLITPADPGPYQFNGMILKVSPASGLRKRRSCSASSARRARRLVSVRRLGFRDG